MNEKLLSAGNRAGAVLGKLLEFGYVPAHHVSHVREIVGEYREAMGVPPIEIRPDMRAGVRVRLSDSFIAEDSETGSWARSARGVIAGRVSNDDGLPRIDVEWDDGSDGTYGYDELEVVL